MKTAALTLSLAIGWLIANAAIAGDACNPPGPCTEVQTCGSANHCGRCGHGGCCEKYCKVVCEMKEVKKTVWVVKCSEFCAPMPSCGRGHGCGCGSCDESCTAETTCCDGCRHKCDPCAVERNKCIIPPKCGKVREKKTLEKKEVVCKVPSYKCVVVYACSSCGVQECGSDQTAPLPPAPVKPSPVPPKTAQDMPSPPVAGI